MDITGPQPTALTYAWTIHVPLDEFVQFILFTKNFKSILEKLKYCPSRMCSIDVSRIQLTPNNITDDLVSFLWPLSVVTQIIIPEVVSYLRSSKFDKKCALEKSDFSLNFCAWNRWTALFFIFTQILMFWFLVNNNSAHSNYFLGSHSFGTTANH